MTPRRGPMGGNEVLGPQHTESRGPAGCHLLPGLLLKAKEGLAFWKKPCTCPTFPLPISVHGSAPLPSSLTTWSVTSRGTKNADHWSHSCAKEGLENQCPPSCTQNGPGTQERSTPIRVPACRECPGASLSRYPAETALKCLLCW